MQVCDNFTTSTILKDDDVNEKVKEKKEKMLVHIFWFLKLYFIIYTSININIKILEKINNQPMADSCLK